MFSETLFPTYECKRRHNL